MRASNCHVAPSPADRPATGWETQCIGRTEPGTFAQSDQSSHSRRDAPTYQVVGFPTDRLAQSRLSNVVCQLSVPGGLYLHNKWACRESRVAKRRRNGESRAVRLAPAGAQRRSPRRLEVPRAVGRKSGRGDLRRGGAAIVSADKAEAERFPGPDRFPAFFVWSRPGLTPFLAPPLRHGRHPEETLGKTAGGGPGEHGSAGAPEERGKGRRRRAAKNGGPLSKKGNEVFVGPREPHGGGDIPPGGSSCSARRDPFGPLSSNASLGCCAPRRTSTVARGSSARLPRARRRGDCGPARLNAPVLGGPLAARIVGRPSAVFAFVRRTHTWLASVVSELDPFASALGHALHVVTRLFGDGCSRANGRLRDLTAQPRRRVEELSPLRMVDCCPMPAREGNGSPAGCLCRSAQTTGDDAPAVANVKSGTHAEASLEGAGSGTASRVRRCRTARTGPLAAEPRARPRWVNLPRRTSLDSVSGSIAGCPARASNSLRGSRPRVVPGIGPAQRGAPTGERSSSRCVGGRGGGGTEFNSSACERSKGRI
ncbi:hypothetical protein THAOC_11619 [Thalassiosira oceanica]|uniref:Uncharacterized protein n=1 Tax=Thalassiosira oceanica TaxID=159749 RepID=K0SPV8_THAOC|nr:hypothetical protein THAOC_11619 [Thalassiosira oceanica]|eukprot:EJK67360.1 hypothetical protein THAOC_11619 [Thalassiosira oceanica]